MMKKQAALLLLSCGVCTATDTPPQTCNGKAGEDGTLLMQKQTLVRSRSSHFQEVARGLKAERKELKKQITEKMMSLQHLKDGPDGSDPGVAHLLLSLIDRERLGNESSDVATTHAPARDLWSQYGEKQTKCNGDTGMALANFSACEFEAGKAGKNFFSFNNETKMCVTAHSCNSPLQDQQGWVTFHGSADVGSTPTDWVGFKKSIMGMLDKLAANLADEHQVSEAYGKEVHTRFDHCHTTSTSSSYEQSYRSGIEPHRTCRTEAKSLETIYDACMAKKAAQKETMDLEKAAYDEVNIAPSASLFDAVKPADGEGMKAWLEKVRAHFDQSYTTLLKKEAEMTRTKQVYQSTDADCIPSRTGFQSKENLCNSTLDRMESASCAWARESKTLCDDYAQCYNDKVEGYGLLKDEVKQEEELRKSEFQMGERIKCLVNSINGGSKIDAASLEACDQQGRYSDAHLEVEILPVPEAHTCSVTEEYPCTEAYLKQAYRDIVDGARLAECKQCDGVASAPKVFWSAEEEVAVKALWFAPGTFGQTVGCQEGTVEIKSTKMCEEASKLLRYTYEGTTGVGEDHYPYCNVHPSTNRVFYNTNPKAAGTWERNAAGQLCAVVKKTFSPANGACPARTVASGGSCKVPRFMPNPFGYAGACLVGKSVKPLDACKAASGHLGYDFSGTGSWGGDYPHCMVRPARKQIYYNSHPNPTGGYEPTEVGQLCEVHDGN